MTEIASTTPPDAEDQGEAPRDAQGRPPRAWTAFALTLFPELYPGPLGVSLLGKALRSGIWALETLDFRDYATDKHRTVDAPPTGGGPGLVMRADIAAAAIDDAVRRTTGGSEDRRDGPSILYLSPRGAPFDQRMARRLAASPGVVLIAGRFEGIDERVLEARGVEEVCVGDAVYTSGDIPAMAVLDATVRLLPGVLGDAASLDEESFAAGLLEHPHYTKPALWEGRETPRVLLSGHHGRIAAWRRAQSERLTQERRPDLWAAHLHRKASEDEREISPKQSDATTGQARAPSAEKGQET